MPAKRRVHSPQGPRKAKRAEPLSFIDPCLATLRSKAPEGSEWVHELKFDGYRAQAHVHDGKAVIYTRRGYDWSDRFQSITGALLSSADRPFVLDGEIVVLDQRGVSDFHRLQEDLARRRSDRLTYFVFDLLYLDGYDLRPAPLIERKKLLHGLLGEIGDSRVRASEHIDAEGLEVFRHACELRAEGIVSKQRGAPYRSGRQGSWIKTKCTKSDSYPIVAFVEKLGAKPRRVASLYVGRREGSELLYAGKLRSGYTDVIARDLRERLNSFIRKTSPLSVPVKKPKATWVEPVFEAEVRFSSITADGLLREAVYKGIRDDIAPPVAQRVAAGRRPAGQSSRGGVPKENVLQLLPDAVVPTKEELGAHWAAVAKRALDHLGHRPLKLVRHTRGTTFYHMGRLPPIPSSVHQLKIRKREGGEGTRLWVDDLDGLLGLVAIGAVELHPWNATVEDIEHPDLLVFDLDPGHGIEWQFVIDSALHMRDVLEAEGLDSWPKVTGGKGLHVMVPIEPTMTHDEAHRYCKTLSQRLAKSDQRRYTLSAAPSERSGRLFIDYLRNGRGTTAVGTYSPRAREGFPIAAPVTWQQVERGIRADAIHMHELPRPATRTRSRNMQRGSTRRRSGPRHRTSPRKAYEEPKQ